MLLLFLFCQLLFYHDTQKESIIFVSLKWRSLVGNTTILKNKIVIQIVADVKVLDVKFQ